VRTLQEKILAMSACCPARVARLKLSNLVALSLSSRMDTLELLYRPSLPILTTAKPVRLTMEGLEEEENHREAEEEEGTT